MRPEDELPTATIIEENILDPPANGPSVGHCARRVRALRVNDTVAKAANVLRLSAVSLLPVVEGGQIVGLMSQSRLSLANGHSADTRVGALMMPPIPPLAAHMPAEAGLRHMEQAGLEVAPVVGGSHEMVGVVTRADLLALASGGLRPVRCGGMATPRGVYLTTGVVRAGAGDVGLFLSGVAMALLALLSLALTYVGCWVLDSAFDLGLLAGFGALPGAGAALWAQIIVTASWLAVFALLFRFSPLAGYHAAEHMTVNAIEQGDDVDEGSVSQHSRVHGRCGTNLVVVLLIFGALGQLGLLTGTMAGILALVVVLGRFTIGGLAQKYITTRPPRPHELASGVSAGQQLIAEHQKALGKSPGILRRVWCMGLAQAMAGLLVTFFAVETLFRAAGLSQLLP